MNFFFYLWSLPYLRWHMIITFPVIVLLLIFWWKYFLRYKSIFFTVFIGSLVWGISFDVLATPLLHIYYFNPIKNLGISFLGIPLEEYLFIIFVPQAVAGITLLFRKYLYGKV